MGEPQIHHNTLIRTVFAAEEVIFNEQASPEVGVNTVHHDITYAAETEGCEDTGVSCLKESLELATGQKPVNEYGKGTFRLLTL